MGNSIVKGKDTISGEKLGDVHTLKSMYDNDCVEVRRGNKVYRLGAHVIAQMLDYFYFDVEKKIKHEYLTAPQCIYDEHGGVPVIQVK